MFVFYIYLIKTKDYFVLSLLILMFVFEQSCQAKHFSTVIQNQQNQDIALQQTAASQQHYLSLNNKRKTEKQQKHLSQIESSTTTPWSNAFNFKQASGAQTNPQTGILNAHIKAGNLLSNRGHGPDIDMEVNYSSNATSDPDGVGHGWSWNLTHFNPLTNQLTTSTGQSFYLQQNSDGQWWPLYHKLQDIRIIGDKKTHFVITYANGLRETLDHAGYEIRLEQQNGWSVHFVYTTDEHRLQAVTDDEGHNIVLHYRENNITVVSRGSAEQPAYVLLN